MLEGDSSLLRRLRLDSLKDKDLRPLPVEFLRKYIAYARQYVHPRYQANCADVEHFTSLSFWFFNRAIADSSLLLYLPMKC